MKLFPYPKPQSTHTKSASRSLKAILTLSLVCISVWLTQIAKCHAADFHVNFTQINALTFSFDLFNDFPNGNPNTIFDYQVSLSDGGYEPDINGIAVGPIPNIYWWVHPVASDMTVVEWYDPSDTSDGNIVPQSSLTNFQLRLLRPIPLTQPAGDLFHFATFFDSNTSIVDTQLLSQTRSAPQQDILSINAPIASLFVQAGENVTITLDQYNQVTPVGAYQAYLSFDDSKMTFNAGSYSAAPYASHIASPITAVLGKITLDGQQLPSGSTNTVEANLATLSFTVPALTPDTTTQVVFDAAPPSQFFDTGGPVPATLADGPVIVIDSTPPTITCPNNIAVNTDPGLCSANLNVGFPVVTDALAGVEQVTAIRSDNGAQYGQPAFKAPYNVGVTTITWTVKDRAGNSASCIQTVTVTDAELPVIVCPASYAVHVDPGGNTATVTYAPTATDNCGIQSVVCSPPSGSVLGLGVHTINCTAEDIHGNISTCSFQITVLANVSCTAIDAQTFIFDLFNSYPNASPFSLYDFQVSLSDGIYEPDVNGNAAGAIPDPYWWVPISPDPTVVEWWDPDDLGGGNIAPQTSLNNFMLRLDRPIPLTQPAGDFFFFTTFWDNNNQTPSTTVESATRPAPVQDVLSINSALSSMYVQAGEDVYATVDQFNLVTSVKGYNVFLSFDPIKMNFVSGSYTAAPYAQHANDPISPSGSNIDIDGLQLPFGSTNTQEGTLANLHFHVPGNTPDTTTQIVFRASPPSLLSDLGGDINTAVINGPIIVIDSTPPVLTCPPDIVQTAPIGFCSQTIASIGYARVTDNLAGVEAMNAVRSDNGAHLVETAFDDPYPVGTTTITWSARDRSGNIGTCQQTVTIIDDEDPVVTCPSDITVYADPNTNGAIVNYTVTASDNCGTPFLSYSHPSGSTFPIGTTLVTVTANDGHGNTATCSFNVTVLAANQVTITVELESVVNTALNRCIAFTFGGTGGTEPPYSISQTGTFLNKVCTFNLTIPSGKVYTRISAKDTYNSLQRNLALQVSGHLYTASFTGPSKLICGDATKDNVIDIADFGVFASQYGQYIASPPCGYVGMVTDFSGDGHVGTEDYTFIQVHFLAIGDSAPGNMALASISIKDLAARGVANPMRADLNHDGKVDRADIKLFAQKFLGVRSR